jgi:hypothetical protein
MAPKAFGMRKDRDVNYLVVMDFHMQNALGAI